jgi:hypothetical protein
MTGTLAATAAWPFRNDASAAKTDGLEVEISSVDPALALWLEWKATSLEVEKLVRKEQTLEFRLAQDIGYPCASIEIPNDMERLAIFSKAQISELLGDDPATADIRVEAEAELAAHQALWDTADAEIGWSAVKRQRAKAVESEEALVDALMVTPAMTMAGVAAKLDAVLREGETWEDSSDFPWAQIRSALDDIVRIGRISRSDTLMSGGDRKDRYPAGHMSSCFARIEKPVHVGART